MCQGWAETATCPARRFSHPPAVGWFQPCLVPLEAHQLDEAVWLVFGELEGARADDRLHRAVSCLVHHLLRIDRGRNGPKEGEHERGLLVQSQLDGVFVKRL